jgi:hypothetical protein
MVASQRWRNNSVAVAPAGAVHLHVERSIVGRSGSAQSLADLAPGTPIVISASAPGAIGRCRRVAAEAGVELEREYLAFPSAASPAYLVEDAQATIRLFVDSALVTPPRASFATPIEACLALLRLLSPWRLVRRLAPGRVVVGMKT